MEWGTPFQWVSFLLFSRSGGHKTKETYPTRPGSPTPCKQGLRSFWKFHVAVVQNNGKEMYKKSVRHVQSCFFVHFFAVVLHDYKHETSRNVLGPVYIEWGSPVQWGKFLLFSRSGGHKTKETYPTRPGSPTPCKQGLSYTFYGENVARFLVHFFSTAANFHLALVAAYSSHFVTAVTKFLCCFSNKKMSHLFFISRSRSLSPFFSLTFAGLPPTFSFSLCFYCSIF